MKLRIAVTAIACLGLSLMLARADGMPEPEDENFNPVPSVPGVPAPGVPAKPPKPPKPTPAPAAPAPAADVTPAPAPEPAPPPEPTPAPAPAPTPAPVSEPTPPAKPAPAPVAQKKPVYEVLSVDVALAERQPPFVTVTVKGVARTGGWKDVELRPLPTLAREVGMRSYTLVATSPTGPTTMALTPVTATITIDPLPSDVKTIRVLAETNEVAQTFR